MANARETISLAGEWELSLGQGKTVYSDKEEMNGNDIRKAGREFPSGLSDVSYALEKRYVTIVP